MSEPILLATDLIRHEPATVRVITSLGHRFLQHQLTSRYVRRDGMILEITPPVDGRGPFQMGGMYELHLRLPHQDGTLSVNGSIHKIVLLGQDPKGTLMTVIGIKFVEPTVETRQALEAHELTVATEQGAERSPRVPVHFPVELSGMDVMTPLMARDLSMSGIFISGKPRFEEGKVLNLHFTFPFQRKEVAFQGKVIWAGKKQITGAVEACNGFGIKFCNSAPAARAALAKYYMRNTFEV